MLKLLRHYLTPQLTNNYRARVLHPQLLAFFVLAFFVSGILLSTVRNSFPSVLGITANISVQDLLVLTNEKRQENGLPPLTLNAELGNAAQNKANDMFAKNYWAHIAPDGTSPWYFIKSSGYSYVYAGENLARGYNSASDVVNAWMASPTHRENMLSSKYKDIGFAVVTGNLTGEDTVLVVEMFGSGGAQVAVAPETAQVNNVQTVNSPSVHNLTPTSTPIPLPTQVKEQVAQNSATPAGLVKNTNIASNSQIKPLVNSATFSSNIAVTTIAIFMLVLILDVVIIERKKLLRFVGHNFDHVLFLGLVLVTIIFLLKGSII